MAFSCRNRCFPAVLAYLPLLLGTPVNAELITFSTPPEAMPVFGANPETVVTQTSTNQLHCFYDVSAGASVWSGAGFNWDNFSTPQSEYIDLSSATSITFAVMGTCTNLKLELEDIYTNKAQYYLTGIVPSAPRVFNLPVSSLEEYFPDFDRSRLRFFFLVATYGNTIGKVGTGNEIGNFTIYVNGGLPFKYYVGPSTSQSLTRLPGNPPIQPVGGGNSDTVIRQTEDSTFAVDYDVRTGGWAGVSIPFTRIGSADFSATPSIVIAVSGTPMSVKFEIEDLNGSRLNAYLYNVNGGIRYYAVDMATVAGQGVDIGLVRFINFVVDQPLAGTGPQGSFRVWVPGPAVDTDNDLMPNYVELATGLDPDTPWNINGTDGDPDEDGVRNFDEIIAGTSPTNSSSKPSLQVETAGPTRVLSIQGFAGRAYRVYVCDDLRTAEWTQVGDTQEPPVNAPLEWVLPQTADESLYYRVRISKD